MSPLRQQVKQILPAPIWGAARDSWLTLRHLTLWPGAFLHPARCRSIQRLAAYKDIHRGQRAFILGNGPSLAKTDVSQLQNEISLGMNRVFLAFPQWGFETNYFLSVNDLVIEQSAQDISALGMPKFLSWRSHNNIAEDDHTMFLHSTYERPRFASDMRGRVWEGATVTYTALQLAYFMGCDPVILIGVDHSFNTKGPANTTITSQGDDPDHFDAGYFGRGFRWQLPDLDTSEVAYLMAREAYAADGRLVLDATIGGKLSIFPKVDYASLF